MLLCRFYGPSCPRAYLCHPTLGVLAPLTSSKLDYQLPARQSWGYAKVSTRRYVADDVVRGCVEEGVSRQQHERAGSTDVDAESRAADNRMMPARRLVLNGARCRCFVAMIQSERSEHCDGRWAQLQTRSVGRSAEAQAHSASTCLQEGYWRLRRALASLAQGRLESGLS